MEKSLSILKDSFKELPNNIEAEQSVIGSILVSNEIFDDIKKDLKTYGLEQRIKELESKFAKDFSQNTFDEIKKLKKEQNIN